MEQESPKTTFTWQSRCCRAALTPPHRDRDYGNKQRRPCICTGYTNDSTACSDGSPVAGQQFEYAFDEIGNRRWTRAGGDNGGSGLRLARYTNNLLQRQRVFGPHPGSLPV